MGYKIVYDKKTCIGARECEHIAPEFWQVGPDNQATLAGSREVEPGVFELDISDDQLKRQQQVKGCCPMGCVRIVKG